MYIGLQQTGHPLLVAVVTVATFSCAGNAAFTTTKFALEQEAKFRHHLES